MMGYYNNVVIMFINGNNEVDWRMAGQMLPSGAAPVAVVNYNTATITEIINDLNYSQIIEFANNLRENAGWGKPKNTFDDFLVPPKNGWNYIES